MAFEYTSTGIETQYKEIMSLSKTISSNSYKSDDLEKAKKYLQEHDTFQKDWEDIVIPPRCIDRYCSAVNSLKTALSNVKSNTEKKEVVPAEMSNINSLENIIPLLL